MVLNLYIPEPDLSRQIGRESRKAYARRVHEGFWDKWLKGPNVLDIGYRGDLGSETIVEGAYGIELGDSGYDGFHLPRLPFGLADTIHASHVLEHVEPASEYIREWWRALRVGGTLIIFVPHAYLYERRRTVPPSRWSPEHLTAYTLLSLSAVIEAALKPNTYRVRHLAENDDGYDYTLPVDVHPVGCFEIELVLQKIAEPVWKVEP